MNPHLRGWSQAGERGKEILFCISTNCNNITDGLTNQGGGIPNKYRHKKSHEFNDNGIIWLSITDQFCLINFFF